MDGHNEGESTVLRSVTYAYVHLSASLYGALPKEAITYTGCPGGKVNILGSHSIGHSKQKLYMCMCPIPVSEIELFHRRVPKLLERKIYYVLFLIPVFIVQVTKLVQFTLYNTFSNIQPSTSMCVVFLIVHIKCPHHK
jgi:hypothetical protein